MPMTILNEKRQRHRDAEIAVLAGTKVWLSARGTPMEADAATWLERAYAAFEAARAEYEAEVDRELALAKLAMAALPLTLVRT